MAASLAPSVLRNVLRAGRRRSRSRVSESVRRAVEDWTRWASQLWSRASRRIVSAISTAASRPAARASVCLAATAGAALDTGDQVDCDRADAHALYVASGLRLKVIVCRA